MRLPRKMRLCRSSANVPCLPSFSKCCKTLMFCALLTRSTISCACHAKRHLNLQKWSEPLVFWTFWLRNVLRATTACTFSTLPKVVRTWCVLYILTSKCASRHNGVHFLTSQLPKVVRHWGVLRILTSKCASRHNGVQFFISPLASWLRTRRFSEPTFRPSGATNHWKNTVNRDLFAHLHLLSSYSFSSTLLSSNLSLLSASSLLCFSSLSEVWLLNFLRLYTYIYKQ